MFLPEDGRKNMQSPSTIDYRSDEQYSAASRLGRIMKWMPFCAACDRTNQRADRNRERQKTSFWEDNLLTRSDVDFSLINIFYVFF